MISLVMPRIAKVKRHPVTVELRHCLRRLRITWQLTKLNKMDKQAACELAYERARVKRMAINFEELLADNQRRRNKLQQEMRSLNGGNHA